MPRMTAIEHEPAGMLNGIPLCNYPEAQKYLLTPEDLVKMGKGTLNDSMWAPRNASQRQDWQKHSHLLTNRHDKEEGLPPKQSKPNSTVCESSSHTKHRQTDHHSSKPYNFTHTGSQTTQVPYFGDTQKSGQYRERRTLEPKMPLEGISSSPMDSRIKSAPSTDSNSTRSSVLSDLPTKLKEDEFLAFIEKKNQQVLRSVSFSKPGDANVVSSASIEALFSGPAPTDTISSHSESTQPLTKTKKDNDLRTTPASQIGCSKNRKAVASSVDSEEAIKIHDDAFLAFLQKKVSKAAVTKGVGGNSASGGHHDYQAPKPARTSESFVPHDTSSKRPTADARNNTAIAISGAETGEAGKPFDSYLIKHASEHPHHFAGTLHEDVVDTIQPKQRSLEKKQNTRTASLQQRGTKINMANKSLTFSTPVEPVQFKKQPDNSTQKKQTRNWIESESQNLATTPGTFLASDSRIGRPSDVSLASGLENLGPSYVRPHAIDTSANVNATDLCYMQAESLPNQQESLNEAWNVQPNCLKEDLTRVAGLIIGELKQKAPFAKLTENALAETTGQAPRPRPIDSFEEKVSTIDSEANPKAIMRANWKKLGAEQRLDRDGKLRLPATTDWESDRGDFDSEYVSSYITEWSASAPSGRAVQVDCSVEEFKLGMPVSNTIFAKTESSFDTFPNSQDCENEAARIRQTSFTESLRFISKIEKAERAARKQAGHLAENDRAISNSKPEPHPFAPRIDMYLRPVEDKDIKGVTAIYNHYVDHSTIVEDQAKVTSAEIKHMIDIARHEKIPFIVAVKGNIPNLEVPISKTPRKIILPEYEQVLGFSLCESSNYGFGGQRTGRSRYTAKLHVYVHSQYLRKRIGRSLLDRLMQTMSACYHAADGYTWLNPNSDVNYNQGLGNRWHQFLIEYPILQKDDPTLDWMKEFLAKFYFKDNARLTSIGRTSVAQGVAKWLDTVYFQTEASPAAEFDQFV